MQIMRLNPCFSGRYSLTPTQYDWYYAKYLCLNPCFSGRYSLTEVSLPEGKTQEES